MLPLSLQHELPHRHTMCSFPVHLKGLTTSVPTFPIGHSDDADIWPSPYHVFGIIWLQRPASLQSLVPRIRV